MVLKIRFSKKVSRKYFLHLTHLHKQNYGKIYKKRIF